MLTTRSSVGGIETTEERVHVRDRLMKCQSCNDTNNNDQQTKNSYTTHCNSSMPTPTVGISS